jgi:hypothetical protein
MTSARGILWGLILLIAIAGRAQAQCTGFLKIDTAGVGHLPICDLLPALNPPPAPDTGLYKIVASVILDSLRAGGGATMQRLYGLGAWAFFQRAGAPVMEGVSSPVRCPANNSDGATKVGHNITAYMFGHRDREAWILYIDKTCVRPRPGLDDEVVSENGAWLIEWTGVAWRLGGRFVARR